MTRYMQHAWRALLLLTLVPALASADPVRNWISDSYRNDRRAVNQSENFTEDRLRDRQNAIEDRQREAWKAARRNAPPQVRAQLDRDYNAQRKATERQFDQDRDNVRLRYNGTRDAMQYDYRQSLRNYEFDRRHPSRYYAPGMPPFGAPTIAPAYDEPREEVFGYPDRGVEF